MRTKDGLIEAKDIEMLPQSPAGRGERLPGLGGRR